MNNTMTPEEAGTILRSVQARQAELGEQIESGERSINDRLEQYDRKVDEVTRSIEAVRDARARAEVEAFDVPTGTDADLRDFVARSEDGEIIGVRMVDVDGEIVDQYTGERGLTRLPGFLTSRPRSEWHAEVQRAHRNEAMARGLDMPADFQARARGERIKVWAQAPKAIRGAFRAMHAAGGAVRRAALWGTRAEQRGFGSDAGSGAEWIPRTDITSVYRPFAFEGSELAAFQRREVSGPTKVPKLTGNPRLYKGSKTGYDDPALISASNVSTDSDTIDVGVAQMRIPLNRAAIADAGPGILQEIMDLGMRAARFALADCVLNGDGATTHQDAIASWDIRSFWGSSGLGGSNDHRRLYEGLRADAYDTSTTTDQSAASDFVTALVATAALLGERGVDDLACFVSPERLVADVMTDPKVVTLDVFGEQATIKSDPRQLGKLFHVSMVVTRWLEPTMATSGLYTGSGATDSFVVASLGEWELVVRQDQAITMQADPKRGHDHLVIEVRIELRKRAGASDKCAAVAYNLT